MKINYFSTFYDSTYQRNLYYTLNNIHEFLKVYSNRIKLDILLNSSLIITDAMYYDGIFFHKLIEYDRESFNSFIGFVRFINGDISNERTFTIKERVIDDTIVVKMITNPNFIISALSENSGKLLRNIINKAIAENEECVKFTLRDFVALISEKLEGSSEATEIRHYFEILQILSDGCRGSINLSSKWNGDYKALLNKNRKEFIAKDLQPFYSQIDIINFEVIPKLKEIITNDKMQRSELKSLFDEYERNEFISRNNEYLSIVRKLRYRSEAIYNNTLADQHGCRLRCIDDCNLGFSEPLDLEHNGNGNLQVYSQPVEPTFLNSLSNLDWDEFKDITCNSEFVEGNNKYCNVLLSAYGNDFNVGCFSRDIRRYYNFLSKNIIQSSSTSIPIIVKIFSLFGIILLKTLPDQSEISLSGNILEALLLLLPNGTKRIFNFTLDARVNRSFKKYCNLSVYK